MDLRNQTGVTVVGVIRQDQTLYSPSGSFQLQQGDTLMLLGQDDEVSHVCELLHGHPL